MKDFPLRKVGEPEDVAVATVYLLSDFGNKVAGIALAVDGGIDMRG